MEEVLGSGLRAEVVEGDDHPLLIDNDPLDVAFDDDPELGLDVLDLDDDPELMSTSSTSNDHRELLSMGKGGGMKKKLKKNGGKKCPKGCAPINPVKRVYHGRFTRGPWANPFSSHKQSTKVVGGRCRTGCKRLKAVVKSTNKDKVACGQFNARYHDAPKAVWYNPNDSNDCRLNIPYCEHFAGKGTCIWEIYDKC